MGGGMRRTGRWLFVRRPTSLSVLRSKTKTKKSLGSLAARLGRWAINGHLLAMTRPRGVGFASFHPGWGGGGGTHVSI